MKKTIKLLVAAVLTLLMVIAVTTTALAASPETGLTNTAVTVQTDTTKEHFAPVMDVTEHENESLVQTGDGNAGTVTELPIGQLLLLALFIESIVNIFKPIWDKTAKRLTIAEVVSMCIGVLIAVVAKINMMAVFITVSSPLLLYTFYIMTGIGIGRGPSFLYDLWKKLQAQKASSQ